MAGGLRFDGLGDMPPGLRRLAAEKLLPEAQKPAPAQPAKYHNVQTEVKGIRFDSKKEARRYQILMDAVYAGLIEDLRLQQDFTLQEAYTTPAGERVRAIRYRADFTYKVVCANYEHICCVGYTDLDWWREAVHQHGRGVLVVEDVKSQATKTAVYRMKYKMMIDKGYLMREV